MRYNGDIISLQYIGDPIDCVVDGVAGEVMDTYCWIHSTFSIPSGWVRHEGVEVPHPGISPEHDLEVIKLRISLGL